MYFFLVENVLALLAPLLSSLIGSRAGSPGERRSEPLQLVVVLAAGPPIQQTKGKKERVEEGEEGEEEVEQTGSSKENGCEN